MNIELENYKSRLLEVMKTTGKIQEYDLEICYNFSENIHEDIVSLLSSYSIKVDTEKGQFYAVELDLAEEISDRLIKKISSTTHDISCNKCEKTTNCKIEEWYFDRKWAEKKFGCIHFKNK